MKESKKQKTPAGEQPGHGKQSTAVKSKQAQGGPSASDGIASKIWDDERFAHLINDPRYRGMPKSKKKVQIDNRFKGMFEDVRFNEKATVDKYGRKIRQTQSDELKKFYELKDSEEETDEEAEKHEREQEERAMEGRAKGEKAASGSDSDADSSDGLELNEEEKNMDIPTKIKTRLKDLDVDYARGEGVLLSESSSDEETDDDEQADDDEVFIEHVWGELDADAERSDDSTKRLAVCHMDWDRIRAVDIMVLLSSFLPRGTSVKSVTIYPSEFGKERIKDEEARGPQELTTRVVDDSAEEKEDEEAQKERLREYQLNRLKYYYAVVVCDSVETADKIYKECDGVEYESTANKIDLRFIPDDMEFDDEPKDICTELPDMNKYVPRIFTTTALTQAKVELTWDENDPERKEFNEKLRDGKWAEMPESELKKYVVCSSSDEEGEDDAAGKAKPKRSIVLVRSPERSSGGSGSESDSDGEPKGRRKEDMIAKYKALLSDIKDQSQPQRDDRIAMEFSWNVGSNGKVDAPGSEEEEEANDEGQGGKGSNSLPNDVNPFEKILQKKKEKSKRRKELKKRRKRGELDGSGGEASENDSSEDDLPFGVDLNDPFFASAFDEKEFDVGNKKKSKKKDREALKLSKEQEEREAAEEARRKAELSLLLDDGEDNRAHFNLRAIQESEIDLKSVSKAKRRRLLKKSKQEIEEQRNAKAAADGFEVDVEDTRFGAIFSKADYNIDPTNPAFKKTKAMERMIDHKLKKRQLAENDVREGAVDAAGWGAKKAKKDVETTMLVKSIKRKMGKAT